MSISRTVPTHRFFHALWRRRPISSFRPLTIYDVFKVVLRQRGESDALQAVALMQQGLIVDLTAEISILAAKVSIEYRLPMADSIILATSRVHEAILWTQD